MKLTKIQKSIALNFIDNNVLSKLSKEYTNENIKSCDNCSNLGTTLIPIGLCWARARCKYCEDYSGWSHIIKLRKEIEDAELIFE